MSDPEPEVDQQTANAKNSPFLILGGLAVALSIVFYLASDQPKLKVVPSESVEDVGMEEAAPELPIEGYSSPDQPPVTIDRVDRTLDDSERKQWADDPSSYGFNDEDRAFLEERGVSESEARAIETILRENGVE